MSQRINHRRGGKRHQDSGPTWETGTPNGGSDSTHVARSRRKWRAMGRRAERRTGRRGASSVMYFKGAGKHPPSPEVED